MATTPATPAVPGTPINPPSASNLSDYAQQLSDIAAHVALLGQGAGRWATLGDMVPASSIPPAGQAIASFPAPLALITLLHGKPKGMADQDWLNAIAALFKTPLPPQTSFEAGTLIDIGELFEQWADEKAGGSPTGPSLADIVVANQFAFAGLSVVRPTFDEGAGATPRLLGTPWAAHDIVLRANSIMQSFDWCGGSRSGANDGRVLGPDPAFWKSHGYGAINHWFQVFIANTYSGPSDVYVEIGAPTLMQLRSGSWSTNGSELTTPDWVAHMDTQNNLTAGDDPTAGNADRAVVTTAGFKYPLSGVITDTSKSSVHGTFGGLNPRWGFTTDGTSAGTLLASAFATGFWARLVHSDGTPYSGVSGIAAISSGDIYFTSTTPNDNLPGNPGMLFPRAKMLSHIWQLCSCDTRDEAGIRASLPPFASMPA